MSARWIRNRHAGLMAIVLIAVALMVCTALAGNQDPRSPQVPASDLPVNATVGGDHGYSPPHSPDQVVVEFTSMTFQVISDFNAEYGTTVQHYLPRLGICLLGITDGTAPTDLVDEMRDDPRIVAVYPNFLIDPMQSVQGSFPLPDTYNAGSYIDQPATEMLMLDQAHAISTGANVRIAVVDGGVNFDHPALDGKAFSGYDYVDTDDDANDEPGGENSGHGTFVAGVIHLIAPDADIFAYRVCDPSGQGDGYVVAEAIMRAVDDGCAIINLSLVTVSHHNAIATAIDYARTRDILVITAAGNGQVSGTPYPAGDPYVIAVGAVDNDLQIADFSNTGDFVDVYAPGVDIYSAYTDGGYAWWSGTSFAAPVVSGQAALIMGMEEMLSESFTREWIIDIIKATTVGLNDAGDGSSFPTNGAGDPGVIDIIASLSAEVPTFAVLADPHSYSDIMVTEYGNTNLYMVSYFVGASDAQPHSYTIDYVDSRDFIDSWVGDPITPASLAFIFDASTLPLGVYQDTVQITVDGVYGSPITKIFTLQVTDGPSPIEAYGIFDYTMHLVVGDTKTYEYLFKVMARRWDYDLNGYVKVQLPYEVMLEDSPEFITDVHLFAEYSGPNSAEYTDGLTTDYWHYAVNVQSLTPGLYYDTVYIYVDSAVNNPFLYEVELDIRKAEYIEFSVIPPIPDNMTIDGYDARLRRYDVTFHDIEVVSTRVDTFYASLAVDGDPRNYRIHPVINAVDYDFIDVNPSIGVTNDTIRFIVDWANHDLDPLDLDTALGYFWRPYDVEVENVADRNYGFQIKIYLAEDQAAPFADNGILDDVTNYPNPFNPITGIQFSLAREADVKVTVFNILGQKVKTLVDGSLSAGWHSISWDGTDDSGRPVASGIYLYRLAAGDVVKSRKMMLIK